MLAVMIPTPSDAVMPTTTNAQPVDANKPPTGCGVSPSVPDCPDGDFAVAGAWSWVSDDADEPPSSMGTAH
jgi:hypothetical protein